MSIFMKTSYFFISILAVTGIALFFVSSGSEKRPEPTNGTMIKTGEEDLDRDKKELWLELMHQSAPGVNWRRLEYENQLAKIRARLEGSRGNCTGGTEVLADGYIQGQWQERGSLNNAGSVFDTEYDAETDKIWVISAGGTLWNGDAFGSSWEVVNQDLQFNPGLLKFVPTDDGRRLMALAGRIPHYSDDDGQTWTAGAGIQHADSWGNCHSPLLLRQDPHAWYVFAKPSYWEPVKLYKSADLGESFQVIETFSTHEFHRFSLCQPHHSQNVYMARQSDDGKALFYKMDLEADTFALLNPESDLNFNGARANLVGWQDPENGDLRLLCYVLEGDVNVVYRSDDEGASWQKLGDLPEGPWDVGMFISPSNPDLMLMGAVDCFRSLDGGLKWQRVNNWWEYYDDINGKLHADMMHFAEFETPNGSPFLLISNHGGLNVSYTEMTTVYNLGLEGLNVSQYYTVRTDPTDPNYVYAGSQDQGFQRALEFETGSDGAEWFEQVISGDYAHIVFSNGGTSLWTVYPGGWVTHYADPQNGYLTGSYDLQSENETVWLPPLMPSPFAGENAVYMAGGNIDGGPGSYLIRLEAAGDQVIPSQIGYNFKLESGGGEVSCLATAPSDSSRWYVATTNGRFFYSEDSGQTWEQTLNFIPEGHYLYGQAIYVSKTNPNIVYLAGSGYSNSPVYRSLNGGKNFTPVSQGLPPTLVFELAANEDESLVFAATEAGPYVYVRPKNRWYDLSGACAPTQTYWSVEYVEATRTVRFGTYGRGIWDFQISEPVSAGQPEIPASTVRAFPNPTSGAFRIQFTKVKENNIPVSVVGPNGGVLRNWNISTVPGATFTEELSLAGLPPAVYYLRVERQNGVEMVKVLKY